MPAVGFMGAGELLRASRKHPRLATGSSVVARAGFPGKLWNESLRYRPWWLALLFISGCFPHREAGLNRNGGSDHRDSGVTCQEEAKCSAGVTAARPEPHWSSLQTPSGRLLSVKDALNNLTQYFYDANGN